MTRPPNDGVPSAPGGAPVAKAVTREPTSAQSPAEENRVLVAASAFPSGNAAGPVDPESTSDSYLAAVIAGPVDPESTSDSYLAALMAGMTQAKTQNQRGQSQPAAHNPPAAISLGLIPDIDGWSQDISLDFPPGQSVNLGPETQKAAESMERNSLWALEESEDSHILPVDSEPVLPSHSTPQRLPSPLDKLLPNRSKHDLSDEAVVPNRKQWQTSPEGALRDGQGSSPIETSIDQGPTEQSRDQSSMKRIDVALDQSQDSSSPDIEPSLPRGIQDHGGFLSPLPKRLGRHRDGGPIQSTCPDEDYPSPHPDVTVQLLKQQGRLGPHGGPIQSTCLNVDCPSPLGSLDLPKQTAPQGPGAGGFLSPLPKKQARHRDGGPIQSTCPDEDYPSPHPDVTIQLLKQQGPLVPQGVPIQSTSPNDDCPSPRGTLELSQQPAPQGPDADTPIPDSQPLDSSPSVQENSFPQSGHRPDEQSSPPHIPLRVVAQASKSAEHETPDGRVKLISNLSRSPTLSRDPSRASTDTSARLRRLTERTPSDSTVIDPISDLADARPVDTSASLPTADNIPLTESLGSSLPLPETQLVDPGSLPAVESEQRESRQPSGNLGNSATAHEPNQPPRSVLVPETPDQVPSNARHPQSPSERIRFSSRGDPLTPFATTASLLSPEPVDPLAVPRAAMHESQEASGIHAPALKPNKRPRSILAPETPAEVPSALTRPQSPSERIRRLSRGGPLKSAVASAPVVSSDQVARLAIGRSGTQEFQQASESQGVSAPAQKPTNKSSRLVLAPETPAQVPSISTRPQSPSERIGIPTRSRPPGATAVSLLTSKNVDRPAVRLDTAGGRALDGINPSITAQAEHREETGNGGQSSLGKRKRTSHEDEIDSRSVSPGIPDATDEPQDSRIRRASSGIGENVPYGSREASISHGRRTEAVPRPTTPTGSSAASESIDRPAGAREQASAGTTPGTSRVAVVIPQRKHKAPARRAPGFPRFPSQANLPSHLPQPAMTSHRPAGQFPVQRVLAYYPDSGVFSPGQICSVMPDQVVVKFDDGTVQTRELTRLRRCEICVGDLVKYIGTDLADQESQFTDVRDPKRVLRVELVAEDRSPGCHLPNDVVVCCNEEDFEESLEGSSTDANSFSTHSRFLVEAIQVVPDGPRKHHGLSDRLLPEDVTKIFQELMKARSGVGKRVKTAARRAQLNSAAAAIASPEHFFQGLGILITSTATEPRPPGRKKTVNFREMIEQQIRERHGTVIDKVTELYELTSADNLPNTAAATKGKQRARFDDDYEACQLRPAPKHQGLRQIILVAESSTKTFKYLMSLALGIPCVSTKWVTDSYEQGSALDWENYMIGPGPSAFLNGSHALNNLQSRLVDRSAHDLAAIFNSHDSLKIFNDKTFIYVSLKAKDKSDWAESIRPILCATGATRVAFIQSKDLQKSPDKLDSTKEFHFILLEDHLQPDLFQEQSSAKRRKVTQTARRGNKQTVVENNSTDRIVDWEWVKQCLIIGRILKPQLFAPQVSSIRPRQKR